MHDHFGLYVGINYYRDYLFIGFFQRNFNREMTAPLLQLTSIFCLLKENKS